MTVKELIEELQKMPQDKEVFNEGFGSKVNRIFLYDNYPLNDKANPYCEYLDVVMIE